MNKSLSYIIIMLVSYVKANFKLRHLNYATGAEGKENLRHLTYATGMEEPHYLRHLSYTNDAENEKFTDVYNTNY